jgi:hypothetical protein
MSITRQARQLYPDNRRLAARWVLAQLYLERTNNAILSGAPAKWRGREERRKRPREQMNTHCVEITVMDRYA